jgi:UDP-N-acetylmuramate--alanine ligase
VEPILVTDNGELPRTLLGVLEAGDVMVTQGAGDIGRLAALLAGGALKGEGS